MNACYDQYRVYYDSQQYGLAIPPLKEMIQILDTTTVDVDELVINKYKSDGYYDLACCYSLTHQKKPALKALEQAVQSGYRDYANMKSDSDLDFIRKERKFKALQEQLRQFDHLFMLKSAGAYREENTDSLPQFSYQPAEDVRLQMVRELFHLDSVAGQGSELSKQDDEWVKNTHDSGYYWQAPK